jgi:hypothetical protein
VIFGEAVGVTLILSPKRYITAPLFPSPPLFVVMPTTFKIPPLQKRHAVVSCPVGGPPTQLLRSATTCLAWPDWSRHPRRPPSTGVAPPPHPRRTAAERHWRGTMAVCDGTMRRGIERGRMCDRGGMLREGL